mgnify:CR=1 FL=1
MKFKVGDKVKIREDSDYYRDGCYSYPVDTIGVIERIGTSRNRHWVEWPNGYCYAYMGYELEFPEEVLFEL